MRKQETKQAQLTESLEDYLEAIAELIAVEGHAHSKDIAAKLHVKMSSVNGAIRQLEKMNYIVYSTHYPVSLTPAGKAAADDVIHRHSVLKKFFSTILGIPLAKASETACHIEHVVDADTIERLILFSEAIVNRSDARRLQTHLTEAMALLDLPEKDRPRVLASFQAGDRVVIDRFSRNLADPAAVGVSPGETALLVGASLDRTMLRLTVGDQAREIPMEVAENIWAKAVGN